MVRTFIDHCQLDIPYAVLCPIYFLRYPNQLATHVISVDVLSREIITRRQASTSQTQSKLDPSPLTNFSDPGSSRQAAWQLRQSSSSSSSIEDDQQQEDVQHVLKTTRLILKRGTLPKWAPAGIVRNAESWVLEESEMDLDPSSTKEGRKMKCWTRNLDHTTVMAVTENLTFSEKGPILKKIGGGSSNSIGSTQLDSKHDIESSMGFGLVQSRIEKFGFQRVKTHVETSRKGLWMTYSQFLYDRKREGILNHSIGDLLKRQLRAQMGEGVLASGEGEDQIGEQGLIVQQSKRARLLAALRPPFLDGDFVGPIARLRRRGEEVRVWWKSLRRGGTADKQHMRIRPDQDEDDAIIIVDQDGKGLKRFLNPMERLRKRFLSIRDGNSNIDNNHHPHPHPALHPAGDPSQG